MAAAEPASRRRSFFEMSISPDSKSRRQPEPLPLPPSSSRPSSSTAAPATTTTTSVLSNLSVEELDVSDSGSAAADRILQSWVKHEPATKGTKIKE